MTPISCDTSTRAMPRLALQLEQQRQDLVLDRDVERGRRLVGQHQLRRAGHRHGDHRALQHAAGPLMRIVVDPAAPGSGCRRGAAARWRAVARRAAGRCRGAARRPSAIWSPMGQTGLRLVIGFWKIMRDVVAAQPRASPPRRARSRSRPAKRRRLARDAGRRRGQQPQDRAAKHRLAAAGFADDAERLAGPDRERDVVVGADRPGAAELVVRPATEQVSAMPSSSAAGGAPVIASYQVP